jgi:hypothetical protein
MRIDQQVLTRPEWAGVDIDDKVVTKRRIE